MPALGPTGFSGCHVQLAARSVWRRIPLRSWSGLRLACAFLLRGRRSAFASRLASAPVLALAFLPCGQLQLPVRQPSGLQALFWARRLWQRLSPASPRQRPQLRQPLPHVRIRFVQARRFLFAGCLLLPASLLGGGPIKPLVRGRRRSFVRPVWRFLFLYVPSRAAVSRPGSFPFRARTCRRYQRPPCWCWRSHTSEERRV